MIIHTCLSIEGAIRNAKDLKGCLTVDGKTLDTIKEIRDYMRKQLAEGKKVLPMCNCEGFSFETGCPKHTEEAARKHDAVCQIAQAICDEKETCERYCGICTDCKAYQDAKKMYEERKG